VNEPSPKITKGLFNFILFLNFVITPAYSSD